MHLRTLPILGFAMTLSSVASLYADVIYVDNGQTPSTEDGTSWVTAYTDLQAALAASTAGDQIWIADGTYYPVTPVDPANPTAAEQAVSFELKAGVSLYGGFKGTEDSLENRPFNPSFTRLSGDIGQDDSGVVAEVGFVGKNSYHVVSVDGAAGCLLHGLTIEHGGDASVSDADDRAGGGIFVNDSGTLEIEKCRFFDNYSRNGGALYTKKTDVLLENCEFERNHVTRNGGAVFAQNNIDDGSPVFQAVDCFFRGNSSDDAGGVFGATYADVRFYNSHFRSNSAALGGGVSTYRTNGVWMNCLWTENVASDLGGAVRHRSGGVLRFINNTFYANSATNQAHVFYNDAASTQQVANSVLWHGDSLPASGDLVHSLSGVVNYTSSLVQGVDLTGVGVGNLDGTLATSNPEFTDPTDDAFGVRAYSPLVNAGADLATIAGSADVPDVDGDGDVSEVFPTDLGGTERVYGQAVDIGAFEHEVPFEVEDLLEYGSSDLSKRVKDFDFIEAVESEDDVLVMNSSDPSVATVAHPLDEGEADTSSAELIVHGYGTTNISFDFTYKGGAVHRFVQAVTVTPDPLESRDLSALNDVVYTGSDFGATKDYADLAAVFTDSPDSFSVVSSDTDVFTVSHTAGDVDVVPVGFGQADLTLRAHYSDGTVLEALRSVTVNLEAASQAAVDAVVDSNIGLNGESATFNFADLSVALTEGVTGITVSSSSPGIVTVSESGGIVTVSPETAGSAMITINLQYSSGEVYTVQKTVRVLDMDGHLHAYYPLDGNATDAQGMHDASTSVDGVTWNATDVVVGEDGELSAPTSLSNDLFLVDGSLQMNFRFKIDSAAEDGIKRLMSLKTGKSIAATAGGLQFRYGDDNTDSGQVVIFFNYADGVSSDEYLYRNVATCNIGEWYELSLVFDFDRGVWSVEIGEQLTTEVISKEDGYQYDVAAMKAAMQASELVFGLFVKQGAQDAAEESDLRVDEVKVYSPAIEKYSEVVMALDALADHVTGSATLSSADQDAHYGAIQEGLTFVDFEKVKASIENYMTTYEASNTALFPSDTQVNPTSFDVPSQALMFVQQWVHDTQFTTENVAAVSGYTFEAHESFPGSVPAGEPRVASATVTVDGDYATDPGALMIWADTVLRPLGYYAPAGEPVTITVDSGLTSLGLEIVVGAHVRNLDPDVKPNINRFRDIAAEFELNQSTITVASPFGGGLYLRMPDGTAAGEIDVTIQGAVKSAYFSARAGKETNVTAWLAEVAASQVPWVDFESDKFMTTIPLSMAQAVTDPAGVMERWDLIMDQYRMMNGRPFDNRIRAEYYLLDRMLVTPAWGAGYPMVVPQGVAESSDDWNPMMVLTQIPNRTLFHELGHNCAIPGPVHNPVTRILQDGSTKELGSWAEGESLVNLPYAIIANRVYGHSIDDSFKGATHQPLTINQAALDWMVTENFRNNRQIGLDTSGVFDISNNNATDELRYQARGLGRYADIVKIFGWEGLQKIHSEFYPIRDEDTYSLSGKRHRLNRDAFIRRCSEAMGVNMAPLLHFWGVKPSDSLKAELATMPKSSAIRDMLDHYKSIAPTTAAEFVSLADTMKPLVGSYQDDRYDFLIANHGDGLTDADVLEISTQIEFIIAEYGLEDYDDWHADMGLVQGVNAGQDDDPDADGLSNFMEFALGSHPLSQSDKAKAKVQAGVQDDTMEVSFKLAQSELHYQVEQSTDLINWTVVWDSRVDTENLATEGQQQTVTDGVSEIDARFYRVRAAE